MSSSLLSEYMCAYKAPCIFSNVFLTETLLINVSFLNQCRTDYCKMNRSGEEQFMMCMGDRKVPQAMIFGFMRGVLLHTSSF